MDKSYWQWWDWTPCYAIGDTLHGNKVQLDGWCPSCGKMRLWAPGYGYPELDKGVPHFDPDFKGVVSLMCPACGYQGSFYIDVPKRKVFLAREVISRGLL